MYRIRTIFAEIARYLIEYHLDKFMAPVLCDLIHDREFCQNRHTESEKK